MIENCILLAGVRVHEHWRPHGSHQEMGETTYSTFFIEHCLLHYVSFIHYTPSPIPRVTGCNLGVDIEVRFQSARANHFNQFFRFINCEAINKIHPVRRCTLNNYFPTLFQRPNTLYQQCGVLALRLRAYRQVNNCLLKLLLHQVRRWTTCYRLWFQRWPPKTSLE